MGMLNGVTEEARMRIRLFCSITTIFLITGCLGTPTPTISPAATNVNATKQPILPGIPIKGQLSGLSADKKATISIYLLSTSNQPAVWARRGNGDWELTVSPNYQTYQIMAEAEGYVVVPIRYTIQLDNMKAFIIENGHLTDKEAVHLDFSFSSTILSTQDN
jgi:hypothetical protein